MFCASLQIVERSAEYLNFLTLSLSDSQSSLDLILIPESCVQLCLKKLLCPVRVQSKSCTLQWFFAALAALYLPNE